MSISDLNAYFGSLKEIIQFVIIYEHDMSKNSFQIIEEYIGIYAQQKKLFRHHVRRARNNALDQNLVFFCTQSPTLL